MSLSVRRSLLAAVTVLLIGGTVTVVALLAGRDDDRAARLAAEHYLEVLTDEAKAPSDLLDLVSTDDPAGLERANTLLSASVERISDVDLGPSREVRTARSTSTRRFDEYAEFEVTYSLAGEARRGTITLGLPRSAEDDGWLVVTPLAGAVDWGTATWGSTLLDLTVGDVEVTEPGRTSYEPDAQLVHPAVYPVRASVGPYFRSGVSDLAVAADTKPMPVPSLHLEPTAKGTAAIEKRVRAAFRPCSRGTAYCPVLDLVEPRDDDLPAGWWRGLTTAPTVSVDGVDVTLRRGAFRYLSPTGVRSVAFDGTATVTIDPVTRRPGVAVPLTLTRR